MAQVGVEGDAAAAVSVRLSFCLAAVDVAFRVVKISPPPVLTVRLLSSVTGPLRRISASVVVTARVLALLGPASKTIPRWRREWP